MTADGLPLTNEEILKLTDEQRAILGELGLYAAQELNLSKLITETADQVKRSMTEAGFTRSDRPRLLHEDPEVEILVSVKPRHKIANVQSQIRRTLARAVELGLGKYSLIRRQCANYGVPVEP
jgi:hypothetical protein